EQVDVGFGGGADAVADAVDQGADVVLDAGLFLVDLLGGDRGGSPADLGSGLVRADAGVGEDLGEGGLDAGQVPDLGAFGGVGVQALVEVAVGQVVAGVEGGGGIEGVHQGL